MNITKVIEIAGKISSNGPEVGGKVSDDENSLDNKRLIGAREYSRNRSIGRMLFTT